MTLEDIGVWLGILGLTLLAAGGLTLWITIGYYIMTSGSSPIFSTIFSLLYLGVTSLVPSFAIYEHIRDNP